MTSYISGHLATGALSRFFKQKSVSIDSVISCLEHNAEWNSATIASDYRLLIEAIGNPKKSNPSTIYL